MGFNAFGRKRLLAFSSLAVLAASLGLAGCNGGNSSGTGAVGTMADYGVLTDEVLAANSASLFGIVAPLTDSYDGHVPRSAVATADDTVLLADGLSAAFLTRDAAHNTDMMDFWPLGANPTHL
ncbi:MAG TPA: hypothetical protein ENN42_05880, partial [Thioalkalivibrio sp.]|nr:hypothetical protein [Thioalkalivibrio sp.]